jgi:transposase
MRHEITDYEWAAIKPFLPNKPRAVTEIDTGLAFVRREVRDAIARLEPEITKHAEIATKLRAEIAAQLAALDDIVERWRNHHRARRHSCRRCSGACRTDCTSQRRGRRSAIIGVGKLL